MQFGHFDDARREYVITTPKTPLPWINYLGSEAFFSLVSNTAGGYSFYRDAKLRRLTRYRYNDAPADANGRYFYIKEGDAVWNPGWQPTQTPLDRYACRHGLGYTILQSAKNGLAARQEIFVPVGDSCEVDRLTLKNETAAPKKVQVFSYVEFCLWNAVDDSTNFQRNFSTGEVEVEGSMICHKTEYRERRNHYAIWTVNAPVDGFVHLIPARARERILDIAATQFENGGAYHQYQPLTKKGNMDIGAGFNDDPLWLIAAVSAYLRETGDFSILHEQVDFNNDPALARPLMEHLRRSYRYTLHNRGPHGLPLIGRADWNDCLNLNCFSETPGESFQTTGPSEGPVAESVFIGGMFVKYAREYADICDAMGLADEGRAARAEADGMADILLDAGWDGAWFRRAYDAAGRWAAGSARKARSSSSRRASASWRGWGSRAARPP